MRTFVTGTGRCGSVTFARACDHATNVSVDHEEYRGFCYPDGHVSINPQHRSCIRELVKRYPDAKWIHLVRVDREACARSLVNLGRGAVLRAHYSLYPSSTPFKRYVAPSSLTPAQLLTVARRFYDDWNAIIEDQLSVSGVDAKRLELEHAADQWTKLWEWMGLEGNREASTLEWRTRHNSTESRPGERLL